MTPSSIRFVGLAVAPIAWAATTQLGQILPWRDCAAGSSWTLVSFAAAIALSASGSIFGLGRRQELGTPGEKVGRALQLLEAMFMFAISLQGAAIMLVDPCAR
jgi:hypothetical protein